MKRKEIIILCIVLCFIFSLQTAMAADVDSNSTSTNVSSTSDMMVVDETDDLLSYSYIDDVVEGDGETKSFSQLNDLINGNTDSVIILKDNYVFSQGDDLFINGIQISRPLTIEGNGYTIDGNGQARIFNITSSVTLNNIVFINGYSGDDGGAIIINGDDCVISNSTFTNNTAGDDGGAIYWEGNNGLMYNIICNDNKGISSGTSSSNGGTICLTGSNVTIEKSSFSETYAKIAGGAIFATGNNITIRDTSFANCNVSYNIANTGKTYANGGGALYVLGNNTNVLNCVFEDNSGRQGGSLYVQGNNVTIDMSSFNQNYCYDDGAALYVTGQNDKVYNSNFTHNTAGDDGGAIYWEGDNGELYNITCNDNNGISSTGSSNGGTICLTGSNVTVSKSSFAQTYAKIAGGAIFATGNYINITESSFEWCYVEQNAPVSGKTYVNGGGALYVLGNYSNIICCTFEKSNGREGGIVYIHGYNVTIDKSSFTRGYALNGGVIYIKGVNATISNSNISLSNSTKSGGAIYISGDNSNINNAIFNSTSSFGTGSDAGGAIYIAGDNTEIKGSTFFKSSAQKFGGAIYIKGDNTTVYDSDFISNTAKVTDGAEGGAIYIAGANTNITLSNFENNEVKARGGAIYIKGVNTNISYSNFTNNFANTQAGAIYMVGANSIVYGSNFTKNRATSDGGAMFVEGLNTKVYYSYFDSNSAATAGTILWKGGYDGNEIVGSVFANSKATGRKNHGGAIYWDQGSTISSTGSGALIKDTLFINNSATHHGGAVDWYRTDNSVIDNCIFINNHISSGDGGALYCGAQGSHQGLNFTIKNSRFINNTAITCGGAIAFQMKNSLIINCNFSDNTASYGGDISMKEGQASGTVVNNCIFANSTANGKSGSGGHQGGSIFISDSDVSVLNCEFYNATSLRTNGGAIYWSGTNPKLINITIVNATALAPSAYGGAICINRNLATIINVTCNDSGSYQGGAIAFMGEGLATVTNITINSCYATANGGGIYVKSSSTRNMFNSITINNSTAGMNGGGMYVEAGTTINNIRLSGDTANKGGGIYISGSQVTINNLTADSCSAFYSQDIGVDYNAYGGAICWIGDTGIITNLNISNSKSDNYGGAIYASGYGLNIINANLTSNYADYGGAVYTMSGETSIERNNPITISESSFDKNDARRDGGAIYSGYIATTIENCNFTDNTADNGGAIVIASNYQNINNCSFDGNNATSCGGSIYVKQVVGNTVRDSTFKNSYAYNGGAIYNSGNSGVALYVDNCTFIKNIASHNGGAVYYVILSSTGFPSIYRDYNNFDGRGQDIDGDGRTTVEMNTYSGSYPNVIYTSWFKDNEDYLLNVTAYAEDDVAIVRISNPKDMDKKSLKLIVNLTFYDEDTHSQVFVESIEINKTNYGTYFNSHDQSFNVNFYNLNKTTYNVTVYFEDANYLNKTNSSVSVKITVDTRKGDFYILQKLIEDAINAGQNSITLKRSYYFTDDRFDDATGLPLDDGCMNITDLGSLKNFTIYGAGNIISAKHGAVYGNSRIFNITAANVTLCDITFIDGNASGVFADDVNKGGAIYWAGENGTLVDCIFKESSAEYGGGIYFNSSADNCKIRDCEFYNNIAVMNGGAIDCNASRMNLVNTTFESNIAGEYGAALCREINATEGSGFNNTFISNYAGIGGAALGWINASGIKIDTYTFIDNTAELYGGAIYIGSGSGDCLIKYSYFENNRVLDQEFGKGGAIYVNGNNTQGNVYNSTFIENKAATGGAVYVGNESGLFNITRSGFIKNTANFVGGAIDIEGSSVSLNNSYFRENTASEGGALFVGGVGESNFIYDSYFTSNVATNGKGGAINWNASAGQIFDSNFTNNSALYGGAMYIGGSSSNSQIVNVIFTANNATFNGGAIDWNATGGKLYNNTFISNYAGDYGAALCREANATGGGGKNNTFISNHAGIGGAALGWIDSVGITIDEYYFYDNTADVHGGAIFIGENSHNCTIKNSVFVGNNATVNPDGVTGFGGAIVCLANNATILNSSFTDNTAYEGGAIYVTSLAGNTIIDGSTFRQNTAYIEGGAIGLRASSVTVNASEFYDNVAGEGGAIYLGGDGITNYIGSSVFVGNNATEGYGGAINWLASSGTIKDSNFTSNSAIYGGGIALGLNSANSNLTNIIFDSNYASKNGGAIDCNASHMVLNNVTFKYNVAEEYGAALCREVGATGGRGYNNTFIGNHAGIEGAALGWMGSVGITIDTYFFYNNTAGLGGGAIYVSPTSHNCTIINSTFDGNEALNATAGHGGAIDCHASNATVINSTFSNNKAFNGGAIDVESDSGNTKVINTAFSHNSATNEGGAINVEGSSVTLNNTDFFYNKALNGGALFVGGEGITNYVYYSNFVGNNASGGHGGAIDWVASAGHIIYSNFTSNYANYGGGVYLNGNSRDSNIDHAIFDSNSATVNGGAIDWNATGGNLTNTLFKYNYAGEYGAALCREANSTGGFGYNNTFIGNNAGIAGAALGWLEAKGIAIDLYTFINNTAGKSGGAIYVGEGSNGCNVLNSEFEGNNVLTGRGGDIDWVGFNGYVCNSTFTNSISSHGGSMYVGEDSDNLTIVNASFISCRSLANGGALEVHADNLNITNVKFTSSLALNDGGAILGIGSDNAVINNVSFKYNVVAGAYDIYGNSYGDGGAIYWQNSSNITISNSTFFKDEARTYGSGINIDDCTDVLIYNSTFNSETSGYGVISLLNSDDVTVELTSFNYTGSIYNGGAIYISNSNVNISDSDFNDTKSAWGYGGAIYVDGNATMDNLTFNKCDALDHISSAIFFKNGNSTLSNSSINCTNAILIEESATVYLINNTINGPNPNKNTTYLTVPYSKYNAVDYSVWNDGTLYLDDNDFDYVIFNNGLITSPTSIYILDNKTINATWNENFTFWASIYDDNNNSIISVHTLNSTNDVVGGWYGMPYNSLTIPVYFQGVFHISGKDLGLSDYTPYNGTLNVLAPTKINLDVEQYNQGEKVTVKATIPKDDCELTENVTFIINGESYSRKVIDGIATLELYNLTANTYEVTATYPGDKNHFSSKNYTIFIVGLRETWIRIVINDIVYGQKTVANVTTNANGTVLFSMNGRNERVNITNGRIDVVLPTLLNPGDYSMSVVYLGNEYYAYAMNQTDFKVFKQNSTLNVTPTNIQYGEDEIIKVVLNNNTTGYIKISIANQEYVSPIIDGVADFNITGLAAGTYENVSVVYNGDIHFNGNSTNTTFIVSPSTKDKIDVKVDDILYGQNATIRVLVDTSATGNVTFYVDGEYRGNVNVTNGVAVLENVDNLAGGRHIVNVTYNGDSTYAPKDKNTSFMVNPTNDWDMTIVGKYKPYGQNTTITIDTSRYNLAHKNLTVVIDNDTYVVPIVDGVATLTLNNLSAGSHSASVSYEGDLNYTQKSKKFFPSIPKADTTINLTQNGTDLIATVSGNATGNVTFTVNNVAYTIPLEGRNATLENVLIIGNNYVGATYNGDENYASSETNGVFYVDKLNTPIYVNATNIVYGEIEIINVTVNVDATGYIVITIAGQNYVSELANGFTQFNIGGLAAGNYSDVLVRYYPETVNYTGNVTTTSFEVRATSDYEMDVKVDDITFGQIATVRVLLPTSASGNVTVYVDGINRGNANVSNGVATLDVSDLAGGEHIVNVTYNGDSTYAPKDKNNTKFMVNPTGDWKMGIAGNYKAYGENTVITITTAPYNLTRKNVTVTIDGINYIVPIVDGVATLTLNNLSAGIHEASVTYLGDLNYAEKTQKFFPNIPKATPDISLTQDGSDMIATVSGNATGNVTFYIGDEEYIIPLVGRNATLTDKLKYGNNVVMARYNGDGNYSSVETRGTFYVEKLSSLVNVTVNNTPYGETVEILVQVGENQTGSVKIVVDDKTYMDELENGQAKFYIVRLAVKEYTVNVTYSGDESYSSSVNSTKFNVTKADLAAEVTALNVTIDENVTFIINNMPSDFKGKVNITVINGESYDGDVKSIIEMGKLPAASYSANVTFYGDDNYNNKNLTVYFTVNQQAAYDMSLRVENHTYGEYTEFNVALPGDVSENVNISIDGVLYSVKPTIRYGSVAVATLRLNNLTGGLHLVTASYEDNNYPYSSRSVIFTIPKIETDIDVNFTTPAIAGGSVLFNVSMSQKINGTAVLTVGGQNYIVPLTNGIGSYTLNELIKGTYDVKVEFTGNENYTNSSSSIKQLVVDKAVSTVNLTDVTIEQGEIAEILITVTDGATGIVNVTVNGITQSVGLIDSKAIVYVPNLVNGTYSITVNYAGDDRYLSSENITQFIYVNKVSSYDLTVIASDTVVGGNSTVTVILPADADGVVTIGDKTANVENGKAVIVLDKETSAGDKSVVVYYSDDSKYADNVTGVSATYNVDKAQSGVEITVGNIYVIGDTVTIVLDSFNGTAGVTINGASYEVTDNKVVFTANKTGEYSVVATIAENDNYYGSDDTAVFNIVKAPSSIAIDVNSVYRVSENIVIALNVTNSTGAITVTINGKSYNVTEDNDVIIPGGLAEGTYIILANLAGDDNYETASDFKVFDVVKNNLTISLDEVNGTVYVGSEITFTATLNETVNGTVIFNINGVNYAVSVNNTNITSYTYTPVNNDTLTVVATFVGNDKFNEELSNVILVDVDRIPTELSISIDKTSMYVGDTAVVSVVLGPSINGIVNIKLNSDSQDFGIVDGKFDVTLVDLNKGTYTINATFAGDDKYAPSTSNTITLIVNEKTVPNMSVNITNGTVSVELPEDATGNVTVIVDGSVVNVTDVVNGTAVVYITEILPGNHTVEVIYSGDGNYTGDSNVTEISVPKVSDYSFNVTAVSDLDVVTVDVELPGDIDGVVLVDIDGTGYYLNVTSGKGSVIISGLSPGEYTVVVTYPGDDYYDSKSNSTTVTVNGKQTPGMSVNVTNGTVSVELPEDATGNVTVIVDGSVVNVTDVVNGTAVVYIGNLTPGNHTVEVIYSGDGNYTPYENSTDFEVPKRDNSLNVTVTVDKNDATIAVELPNDINGIVLVDVNGVGYYINVTDGKGSIEFTDLDVGNYTVLVKYPGDSIYEAGENSTSFNINYKDISTPIVIAAPDIYVGENLTVMVIVPNDASGNVTITIDNANHTSEISKGIAKFVIPDLSAGDYIINATYGGDDRYDANATSTVVKVSRITDYPIYITNDIKNITVHLPDDASGNVTLIIEGDTFTGTVVNGTVTIYDPNLTPGNHNITVIYDGDDKYSSTESNMSIEVNNIVIIDAPIVTKYYSGPESFYVYLEDLEGNKISNASVSITINGVKYNRITDENGTASLPLRLPSGNYSVYIEFNGNDEFAPTHVASAVNIRATIYANDVTKVYRNGTQYYALFLDGEGNPLVNTQVSFNINGVFYNRTTNASGWAQLDINLIKGTYILTAINPVTGEMKSNIVQVISQIVENHDLIKEYLNGSQFTVRILADDGSPAGAGEEVTFNIHGRLYTRHTNRDGYATLNINLPPGDYIITTYYKECREGNHIIVLPVGTVKKDE